LRILGLFPEELRMHALIDRRLLKSLAQAA